MTSILANINVGGSASPLVGYIRVEPIYDFNDTVVLYVSEPKDYPLVAGSVTFDVAPSDIAKVSYLFQIWQTGTPDVLIKEFRAIVPFSLATINLTTLATQTGVRYDTQDTSLLTLSRYLYLSDIFWSFLTDRVWNHRGSYDPLAFYKKGDIATIDTGAYQYISNISANGNYVTDTSYWRLLVSRGLTGTGTSGNNAIYGLGWSGQTDAPSRNAVYNKIETLASISQLATLAPLASPSFTGLPTAPTPTIGDNTTKLATTAFVNTTTDNVGKVPVGLISPWGTTSAPSKYRVLTSPGEIVSQTTYPTLFALFGTTYNISSEGAGNFRLPAASTMPVLPSSMRWVVYTGV
jgi:Phage Tail Collar Domain